ncbi:RNA polymerase subunit sigma-70 [Saccharobesus litoralis]|uniref:RNA polymerase subunit sigma-70 n=2 Tax=Saccharobesus litoralis TaxID=2172099 RepID=A0A2S0VXZ0_9ALTE|nr:RNA polymerase subunit sigma-70 [Saccharobesus litoralis]
MAEYALTGDPHLLSLLVEQLGNDLYYYLVKQSDAATAADISQQVWLKVIEKRQRYQSQQKVKPWVFTIARNCLIDHLRLNNKWVQDVDTLLDHPASMDEQPAHQLMQASQKQGFEHLLKQLPFEQREAFILQQEGLSLQQIADVTQTSTETVKSRLRYARNLFKAHRDLLS